MSDLAYTVADGIATITLNRPARRNAFTLEMVEQWRECLHAAAADDDVRVVVLTGAGDAFCAGIDLGTLQNLTVPLDVVLTEKIHGVARAVAALPKPLVAAVRGSAVGAGLDMALMCDVRFADSTATFCEKYVDVGILPGDGGAWLLPRIVGRGRALRMLWSAEHIDAELAERWGLVDVLVADGELEAAVGDFASMLAAKPAPLLAGIKRLVSRGTSSDLLTALVEVASDQRQLRAAARG